MSQTAMHVFVTMVRQVYSQLFNLSVQIQRSNRQSLSKIVSCLRKISAQSHTYMFFTGREVYIGKKRA